jgi:hypothetical protein
MFTAAIAQNYESAPLDGFSNVLIAGLEHKQNPL